jgi:hemerythrin-like domain-containing protein
MSLETATGRAPSKPDLTFVILIHQSLRADAARLAATIAALSPHDRTDRVPGIQTFFGHYREQLAMHHRHEDELFFPALAARVGADKMHLGVLASQHDALDAALHAVSDGLAALADPAGDFGTDHATAASALSAMSRLLAAHLTLEEQTALPLYESEMPAAEHRKLEAKARKATPWPAATFLVPWIITHASPGQRKALFKSAPALPLIYRLSLRHYRRIDQALVWPRKP